MTQERTMMVELLNELGQLDRMIQGLRARVVRWGEALDGLPAGPLAAFARPISPFAWTPLRPGVEIAPGLSCGYEEVAGAGASFRQAVKPSGTPNADSHPFTLEFKTDGPSQWLWLEIQLSGEELSRHRGVFVQGRFASSARGFARATLRYGQDNSETREIKLFGQTVAAEPSTLTETTRLDWPSDSGSGRWASLGVVLEASPGRTWSIEYLSHYAYDPS